MLGALVYKKMSTNVQVIDRTTYSEIKALLKSHKAYFWNDSHYPFYPLWQSYYYREKNLFILDQFWNNPTAPLPVKKEIINLVL